MATGKLPSLPIAFFRKFAEPFGGQAGSVPLYVHVSTCLAKRRIVHCALLLRVTPDGTSAGGHRPTCRCLWPRQQPHELPPLTAIRLLPLVARHEPRRGLHPPDRSRYWPPQAGSLRGGQSPRVTDVSRRNAAHLRLFP